VRIWKIPGPVIRLAILFAAAVAALIVARQMFVPESFGDIGHYRADVVPAIASLEIHYAGLPACAECHDDVAETKAASYHRGLTCEGCHGPAADHVDDPTEKFPVVPTGRSSCLRCHSYLASRPTGFPQIIESIHNPMEACADCHDPHDPTPPMVPGECSACHGQIARTKSVSHHWSLECETCHEAPDGHRENPRASLPSKPTTRMFCGQCHAADASSATEIPRVDMSDHGGRYLCWQCHYPHDPEGR
jgi:ribosomal protein S27AE